MRYDRYGKRIFSFITMFDSGSVQNNVYSLWYRLLHYGVTGSVIWSNTEFFSGTSYALTAYATGLAPTYGEFENGLVKLFNQGDWDDSDVALLYSQKSIQALWMFDSEVDGRTWINRNASYDATAGSLFFDHVGWCKALEDIGVKGRFLSSDEVIAGELTDRRVKVLILPKALALSDAEKAAIQNWVNAGGVLIADNMCAWFDGYLRRRSIAAGGGGGTASWASATPPTIRTNVTGCLARRTLAACSTRPRRPALRTWSPAWAARASTRWRAACGPATARRWSGGPTTPRSLR